MDTNAVCDRFSRFFRMTTVKCWIFFKAFELGNDRKSRVRIGIIITLFKRTCLLNRIAHYMDGYLESLVFP